MNERRFVYVHRFKEVKTPEGIQIVDYGVVEIPEDHLYGTLKVHPLWKLETGPEPMAPQIEPPPAPVGFACPLCPKVFKTEKSLKTHRTKLHS